MYDTLGKAAIRFAVAYLRRRYRRQIRIGAGLAVVAIGIAAYLATRNVPRASRLAQDFVAAYRRLVRVR